MCGINGIFAYHYAANPIDGRELLATRDHMRARGPDGAGAWTSPDGRIGLGHRRLSIIDLSAAGAQPMHDADGRYTLTFNGEIYNYRALRSELEAGGVRFTSHSDTEILLHLYRRDGAAMLARLRGMFAFAIYDALSRRLFLARDPYGIKPLYYADDGWTVRFASQVKALVAGGAVSRDPDPAGWVGYYTFGSVPEPFSTYRAVRAVPAGTYMTVDRLGASAPVRYASITDAFAAERTFDAVRDTERVRAALLDSVRHHLVADVPVGAFLSAGIDSGALVGLMKDVGPSDIRTVTLSFAEFTGAHEDEAPLAARVARHYGSVHTERVVTRAEFDADLPKILDAMDQPSIDGINTWFVSKAARELGLKVAISGIGGDELLGGYPSFHNIRRWVRMLRVPAGVPGLGRVARRAIAHLPGLRASPKAASMLEYAGTFEGAYLLQRGLFMPWELRGVLPDDVVRDGLARLDPLRHIRGALPGPEASSFARVACLEAGLYMRNQLLRDTDWASMAHGLEVRTPLVDHTLLRELAPIAASVSSGAVAKAILARSPSTAIPEAVTTRTKTGFTTPVANWLKSSSGRAAAWRAVPSLTDPACPWARRWAYGVAAT